MIWLNMFLAPPLLLTGLVLRHDWREAALPLVAGVLLIAAWGLGFSGSAPAAMLWMFTPGIAGLLLLVHATRTTLGGVAQGLYAAAGLACIGPTLLFAFIFYALSGDV